MRVSRMEEKKLGEGGLSEPHVQFPEWKRFLAASSEWLNEIDYVQIFMAPLIGVTQTEDDWLKRK